MDFYNECLKCNFKNLLVKDLSDYEVEYGFYYSCEYDNLMSISFLIKNYKINIEKGFIVACERGNIKVVKFLSEYINKNNIFISFTKACENGSLEIMKFLIKNFEINIHLFEDFCFKTSSKLGHFDIINFLLKNYNFDKNVKREAFLISCSYGNFDIVKILSKEIYDEKGFILACENDRIEIVKFLYENFYVNLEELKDEILHKIFYWNKIKVLKYLFDKINFDNFDFKYYSLICCINGYYDIILLLESKKKFEYEFYFFLEKVCLMGHENIFNFLLEREKNEINYYYNNEAFLKNTIKSKNNNITYKILNSYLPSDKVLKECFLSLCFTPENSRSFTPENSRSFTPENLEILLYLIKKYQEIKFDYDTPIVVSGDKGLEIAIRNHNIKIVKNLIEKYNFIEIEKAFFICCENGSEDIFKFLLSKFKIINEKKALEISTLNQKVGISLILLQEYESLDYSIARNDDIERNDDRSRSIYNNKIFYDSCLIEHYETLKFLIILNEKYESSLELLNLIKRCNDISFLIWIEMNTNIKIKNYIDEFFYNEIKREFSLNRLKSATPTPIVVSFDIVVSGDSDIVISSET